MLKKTSSWLYLAKNNAVKDGKTNIKQVTGSYGRER